ncbi:putative Heavy metal efflux system, outer membrane lipoprotein [Nitrospira sp. KM1]|nr:putative Heavy metal efflux system, outer membrane lipoprotein [Nitrospira sp. KM1]
MRAGISLFAMILLALPPYAIATAENSSAYRLDDIVKLALEHNPVVAGANASIDQSAGQRVTAGAYPNPYFSGNSGRGEIRDTGRADIRDDLSRTSLTEYNATIGQPLEWPGKRTARKKAAEAGLAGATAGLAETKLNLSATVKIAFYDLLLAQRDLDLARLNGQTIEDVKRIVKARVRLGEAPQFDAIKAEVEVLKANQLITRMENIVRVNRVVLDTLTGGALGQTFSIAGDFETFPSNMTLDTLVVRAGDQHPTLQRLTNLIQQAERLLEFERQARVPNITVNGSYWREIGREAIQGGITVPTPIWYQQQGEIATALGAKRREEAEWLRARNGLLKEVNQHYQEAQTTATMIGVFEKGLLKQAQEALRLAQFSFQQGASSLLEVLDAQRVQRDIQLDYAQARYDLSVSLARLERSVGGLL